MAAPAPDTPSDATAPAGFEPSLLPHLDAAYGLARWLVGDELLAEDIVQQAYQLAFNHPEGPPPGEAKPWLLTVVHQTAHGWLARHRQQPAAPLPIEEDLDAQAPDRLSAPDVAETLRQLKPGRAQVNAALARLALPLREALVLREIEALSLAQIAQVLGMSKPQAQAQLAQAYRQLALSLRDGDHHDRQPQHER